MKLKQTSINNGIRIYEYKDEEEIVDTIRMLWVRHLDELGDYEQGFVNDLFENFMEYNTHMFLSAKQYNLLMELGSIYE